MYRVFSFIAVVAFLCEQAKAEILTPSTTDLWDISQGATVTGNSAVLHDGSTYSDIRNMFGGVYGNVAGSTGTLFADGLPKNTVDWVEWQTPLPVTIASFALFAGHDAAPSDANQRGFSRFSLYFWDTEDMQWDDVYDLFPANPYGDTVVPANTFMDTSYPSNYLAIQANITPTTAQRFRAEFVQFGPATSYNSGPRVTELDGFSTPYPVPEPATLMLLGSALLGLAGVSYLRRRGAMASTSVNTSTWIKRFETCLRRRIMFGKTTVRGFLAAALVATALTVQADVFNMGGTISGGTWTGLASLSFVTVGDPGNVTDPSSGYGSVGYTYLMGTYDVTLAQYTAFLNAVAKTDTYGLYNSQMADGNGYYPLASAKAVVRGAIATRSPARTPRRTTCPVFEYLGRCGAVLQLAAKRPADRRHRGRRHDGGRGLRIERRDYGRRLYGGHPPRGAPLISFPPRTSGIRLRTTAGAGPTPHITPIRRRATSRRATRLPATRARTTPTIT